MFSKLFRTRGHTGSPSHERYRAEARAYLYRDIVLVCSVRWIAETDSVTRLHDDGSDFELGAAVLRHLAEYDPTEWNIRDRKPVDWAAFKESGAPSVKAFEREAWSVRLAQMNTATLVWASPCKPMDNDGLAAYTAASSNLPEEVGGAFRMACEAARSLWEHKHSND